MSGAGVAAASVWRLRSGARRPFSAYGREISIRRCISGMTLNNINRAIVDRIIQVDHAGEYGATRIYAGHMAVLGRTAVGPVIQKMWNQEKGHLKKLTVLMPLWNVAGFVLGVGTALLGKEGAMACTVAVEESIAHHYNNQIHTLMEEDPGKYEELLQVNKKFRDEELEHHDTGLDHGAELVGPTATCGAFGTPVSKVEGPGFLFPGRDILKCSAKAGSRHMTEKHTSKHWSAPYLSSGAFPFPVRSSTAAATAAVGGFE